MEKSLQNKKSNSIKRVTVYTRDKESASSSYYRILQYFEQLKNDKDLDIKFHPFVPIFLTKLIYNYPNNITVRLTYHLSVFILSTLFFLKDILHKPEIVIILRSITPKTFRLNSFFYEIILKRAKKVIWDFDDDIFYSNEISKKEKELLCKYSTDIVVTHDYLATLLPKDAMEKIKLLPTTDQSFTSDKDIENRNISYNDSFYITWIGSSASIQYIDLFISGIVAASKHLNKFNNKNVILEIVSNKPFLYQNESTSLQIINTIWSREKAIDSLKKAHLGIMPLANNEFEKGKGSFKIIQYMANGLPVIGSKVGYNKKVIKKSFGFLIEDNNIELDLSTCIRKLATDKKLWNKMSDQSYIEWKKEYNFEKNLQNWRELLH